MNVAFFVFIVGLGLAAGLSGEASMGPATEAMNTAATTMGVDLQQMLLVALLNPAAILTGFFIGRRADQVHKIVVGGFVAGFSGLAFVWLMDKLGLYVGDMNSVGGVYALSFLVGMIWSYVGFRTRKVAE